MGTDITLYVNEDCLEFVNEYRAREVITKYCSFMPYEIFIKNVNAEEKTETKSDDKKEPDKKTVFYVTDAKQQAQYIDMFKEQKLDAVILTHNIDNPFIQMLENDNKDVKFVRIDADLSEALKEEGELSEDEVKEVTEVFKKALNNDDGEDKTVSYESPGGCKHWAISLYRKLRSPFR